MKILQTQFGGRTLLEEIEEELIDGIQSLENARKILCLEPELEKFEQTIRNDIDMLTGLKNNLHSWDKAYNMNQILKFVTWPRQKVDCIKKMKQSK